MKYLVKSGAANAGAASTPETDWTQAFTVERNEVPGVELGGRYVHGCNPSMLMWLDKKTSLAIAFMGSAALLSMGWEGLMTESIVAESPSAQILRRTSSDANLEGSTLRNSRGPREFYFTRAAFTGYGFRNFRSWSVDFPKADRQFLIGVRRLTNLNAYELENPIQLTDPNLGRFPFIYAVEVGYMALTDAEVLGLRRYLTAGGFLVIDDFWGSVEWENFQMEFERVLPGFAATEIPLDHPLFSCFYNVKEILQVPNVGNGMKGGRTWEKDGYRPAVRGIFDEKGRLMVVINWNTDLGDAWEWAENPYYPLKFSTYAYQMGVNFIIYGMSH